MHLRKNLTATIGLILLSLQQLPLLHAEEQTKANPPTVAKARTLLIVTPRGFEKELEPFVAHKKKELSVELAFLEDVLAQNQGVDDPEKLKRFLYQAWRERHVHYVLLVGDSEAMPGRYMVPDRYEPAAFNYAFYPCDLYYADVAKEDGSFDDWNAKKDGFHARYFGEVHGETNKTDPINYDEIHYRPELGLGRWPVHTPEEVRTVVAKSIAFENRIAARSPSRPRAALIHNSGWIDARAAMDEYAKSLPKEWTIEKRYYSDDWRKSNDPAPDQAETVKLLNSGVDLMLHAGHGLNDRWEQSLHVNDLGRIKNADHLPVMMSIGCNTAQFCALAPYEAYVDAGGVEHKGTYAGEVFKCPPPPPAAYQKGRYNSRGLGKQLLRAGPNGAVAYIGCNTGGQPCALALMDGFAKSWGKDPSARLGDCWKETVSYYYDQEHLAALRPNADWYPPSIFFQAMKYMLYGDPSLKLPH
jgi:hypothetical protein